MANFKQYIKTSFQDYGLPSDGRGTDAYRIRDDINYLYQKVKDFSRETTQWDLYKITQVVTNQEEFRSQVNNLPPYSSAIIAARFVDDGYSYNKGDLVYKNLDGSTSHIAAERGGIFRPSTITKENNTNNYTFLFQYISKEPGEDDIETVKEENGVWTSKDNDKQQIEFQNITVETPATVYGLIKMKNDFPSGSFTFLKESPFPIIKMYDVNNEEIYTDFNLQSTEDDYTISGIPSIVSKVVVK